MKVLSVDANNHRKAFFINTARGSFWYPYARCGIRPGNLDRVQKVFVDKEIGSEGFSYVLDSGLEGTVHVEQVLEYHEDPEHLRDLLLYKLTIEAKRRIATSALSKREIVRRLATSPTQLYRLLDPANRRKTIDRMVALLSILDCELDLVVKEKPRRRAAATTGAR